MQFELITALRTSNVVEIHSQLHLLVSASTTVSLRACMCIYAQGHTHPTCACDTHVLCWIPCICEHSESFSGRPQPSTFLHKSTDIIGRPICSN